MARAQGREVYFEGQLCRGIIPEQSLWEYDSDNGLLTVYLKKMNLELLSTSHQRPTCGGRGCAQTTRRFSGTTTRRTIATYLTIMRQHEKNELQSKI